MVKKNREVWRKMGFFGPDSDPDKQLLFSIAPKRRFFGEKRGCCGRLGLKNRKGGWKTGSGGGGLGISGCGAVPLRGENTDFADRFFGRRGAGHAAD
jgi:hypothetical protein